MNPVARGNDQPNLAASPKLSISQPANLAGPPSCVPDHELLRKIGGGSYGEVWLAKSKLGTYRAVKIVYRRTFENIRPFEREFKGFRGKTGALSVVRFVRPSKVARKKNRCNSGGQFWTGLSGETPGRRHVEKGS